MADMRVRTRCDLHFEFAHPTPLLAMLRPRSGMHQWVARESYASVPQVTIEERMDLFGNLCQRLVAPAGPFSIHTSAEVIVTVDHHGGPAEFVDVLRLPPAVLDYLRPSRYCESDRFNERTRAIVAGAEPGYGQVRWIAEWVGAHVRYMPGTSTFPLSATEVETRGRGVCRDLTHLAIALCRSISIPARMVVGFLDGLEPMDLHAWFEAYVGDRWHTFDPARPHDRGARVVLAHGRDAADVAIYHQFGPPARYTDIEVAVEAAAEPSEPS